MKRYGLGDMGVGCAAAILVFASSGCSLEVPSKGKGLSIRLEDRQAPLPANLLLASPQAIWDSAALLAATPTVISDFNCFTVNVTGQGVAPSVSMAGCTLTNDPAGAGFGAVASPVARGTPIELDLAAGTNRRIDVYGIFPPTKECAAGSSGSSNANSQGYFV